MCGRYAVAPTVAEAWAPVREVLGAELEVALEALEPRYNIAPSSQVPMIYKEPGTLEVRAALARWGFVPHWWKEPHPPRFATINARSEDAASKPMWKDAWRSRRCLIPATHWYEWKEGPSGKRPYVHQIADGLGFMFAGLWSIWRPTPDAEPMFTCAIITRDAPEPLRKVHDRMPIILHPRGWLRWIEPGKAESGWISDILTEHAITDVAMWEISRAVNRTGNDGPDLLLPIDPADLE